MEQTGEVKTQRPGGARVRKGGGSSIPLIVLGVALAVLVGAYGGLCALAACGGALWKGTHVLGQDVGGLTPGEAAAVVESALPELKIGLYLYDGEMDAAPDREGAPDAQIPLTDLAADIDVPALINQTEAQMKRGSVLTAGWRYLTNSGVTQYGGSGAVQVPSASAAKAAQTAAEQLSVPGQDTSYEMSGGAISIRMAQDGRSVSAQDLQISLEKGAWDGDLGLDVPYFNAPGKSMTAQEIHDAVYGEVKNASYDAATDSIVPEETGADFDVPGAQSLMDAAAPGETVTISAEIQYPAVTAEKLKEVLFRDVLGECSTHVTGTAPRINNVRLAIAAFDGMVLNSGETFSYNDAVGRRTVEKGYGPASAYISGETVDVIGGGICQGSSTLYLACLRANLEITERYAHRYTPSYITWGLDATVSWGSPDYKFTNNTDYPIKIDTEFKNNDCIIRILGTNVDGSYVKMTTETLSSTPFETIRTEDPAMAPGTETVKTTPYTGYKVRSFRNVYSADGSLISSNFEANSDYKSRNRVILYGPGAAPSGGTGPEVPAGGGAAVPVPEPADPANPAEPVPPPAADPTDPGIPVNGPAAGIPEEPEPPIVTPEETNPPTMVVPLQPEEP